MCYAIAPRFNIAANLLIEEAILGLVRLRSVTLGAAENVVVARPANVVFALKCVYVREFQKLTTYKMRHYVLL